MEQCTEDPKFKLVWVASDNNLADCFTKKKREARVHFYEYLVAERWKLKYDPEWIVASRKQGKLAVKQMQADRAERKAQGLNYSLNRLSARSYHRGWVRYGCQMTRSLPRKFVSRILRQTGVC